MNTYLSVVIPCYNEEANLKRGVLKSVYEFLKSENFSWEVIISNDGSTDNSREIVESQIKDFKGFRLINNNHAGKPAALLHGIREAKGDYILLTDMDQSTPITELNKLTPYLKKGKCAVIGSRGLVRKDFPLYRKLGAVVFMSIRRALILPEITDTQCGFKLFDTQSLKRAFPLLEHFRKSQEVIGWKVTSYDVELLHILKKMGCSIQEVPVFWNDKDISKSKGGGLSRYIRESQDMFGQIVRVKINELMGLYKV